MRRPATLRAVLEDAARYVYNAIGPDVNLEEVDAATFADIVLDTLYIAPLSPEERDAIWAMPREERNRIVRGVQ